jgi:FtsP/CotA-like multicopper oxidase with cupredoxin domain
MRAAPFSFFDRTRAKQHASKGERRRDVPEVLMRWLISVSMALLLAFALSVPAAKAESAQKAGAASSEPPIPAPSCWRNLADRFRDAHGRQLFRPLISFKAPKGSPVAFDWSMSLGTAKIGTDAVAFMPLAYVAPKDDVAAEVSFWNPETRKDERCVIPREAFFDEAFRRDWAYSGFWLDMDYEQTIAADVTSALDYSLAPDESTPGVPQNGGHPCQATNLHTHGLLVSPAKRSDGAIGDYVLDLASSPAPPTVDCAKLNGHSHFDSALHYDIRIGKRPPTLDFALKTPYHPPGLFWLHPHPHGSSAQQLRGGASGLITIGGVTELRRYAEGVSGPRNIRHMILKDAQFKPGASGAPGVFLAEYKGDRCGEREAVMALASKSGGYLPGECAGADGVVWRFTVNGVSQPRITEDAQKGDKEVWRIVNSSSNASYRLALRPERDNRVDAGARLPFTILARDGVPASQKDEREVLLMPGARVEIMIDPQQAGADYALVTEGVDTGGDNWPPVKLASLRWLSSPGAEPMKQGPVTPPAFDAATASNLPSAPTSARKLLERPASWKAPTDRCDFPPGSERIVLFVKKPNLGKAKEEVFGMVAGLRAAGDPHWRAPGHSVFFRRDSAGKTIPVDFAAVLAAINAPPKERPDGGFSGLTPSFGNAPSFGDICVAGRHSETWVVENWTNELHNFHIHQTRFQLAPANLANGKADPAYFATPFAEGDAPVCSEDTLKAGTADEVAACVTPTDRHVAEMISDAVNPLKTPPHHDSVPTPRGSAECKGTPATVDDASCKPGRISVMIDFDRDEQRGVFPYHCHVLEHEDLGMMGLVEVLDAAPSPQLKASSVQDATPARLQP